MSLRPGLGEPGDFMRVVCLGLGRVVPSHHHSSAPRQFIQKITFGRSLSEATMRPNPPGLPRGCGRRPDDHRDGGAAGQGPPRHTRGGGGDEARPRRRSCTAHPSTFYQGSRTDSAPPFLMRRCGRTLGGDGHSGAGGGRPRGAVRGAPRAVESIITPCMFCMENHE
jgi:hypothetical protein